MTTLRAVPHAFVRRCRRRRATSTLSDDAFARSGDARDVVRAREDARRRLAV